MMSFDAATGDKCRYILQDARCKTFISQFYSLYISYTYTFAEYIDILVEMGEQLGCLPVFLLPADTCTTNDINDTENNLEESYIYNSHQPHGYINIYINIYIYIYINIYINIYIFIYPMQIFNSCSY